MNELASIQTILLCIVFLYGITVGSFLNVCIFRVPKKEGVVKERSHCMSCGYQLAWFDLIPLFSWIFLRGKCRKCGIKISSQYPIIEGLNGVLWVGIVYTYGLSIESLLYCLMISTLLALSVIDYRTYEIPIGFNIFIFVLGLIRIATDASHWYVYAIGFISVSLFLFLLYFFSGGRAIGGGDIKLMAVTGMVIGWKLIIVAFFFGCFLGSVIHLLRMKISKENHVLAMGPYLSGGILLAILFGQQFLTWYLSLIGY